jgi:ferredoxin
MAVYITEECINCDACAQECPVAAILSDESEKNPYETMRFYVKPESCVECESHADEPRCAEACPTEGCIVWDAPYEGQPSRDDITADMRKGETPCVE